MARVRLTATDWATAALDLLGEKGLAAVAVEPLAARLGTTKGSFYWHYPNRDAVIVAALELWEQAHTQAVIDAIAVHSDPATRLRTLFTQVTTRGIPAIEASLLGVADHPLVAPVMRRVVDRRIAYLHETFRDLGLPAHEAHNRAVAAYAMHVGTVHLATRLPDVIADPAGLAVVGARMLLVDISADTSSPSPRTDLNQATVLPKNLAS